MTVAPSWRRKGIGTMLTEARIELLRGVTDVVYYSAEPGNVATLELHARLGFRVVQPVTVPGFDEPLLLHRLDLA